MVTLRLAVRGCAGALAALLLVVLGAGGRLAPVAWAEELTSQEKSWARAATEALASPSERQRESAAAALARLGVDAVPTVLASLAKLKEDAHWDALARAMIAMGPKQAAKALEDARSMWPKAQAVRLQTLLDRVREAKEPAAADPGAAAGPGAPLPAAPAGLAARVKAFLDSIEAASRWSSEDPRTAEFIAEGRPVIQPMLDELRRRDRHSMASTAACQVLERLLTVEDLPHIRAMLEDGHHGAAPAVKRLPAAQTVPVLLVPMEKLDLSFRLLDALEAFASDPRVPKAVLRWLDGQTGEDGSSLVGQAAELLGTQRYAEARSVLERLVFDDGFPTARRHVATALVDLGVVMGVVRLIDYFRSPPDEGGFMDAWGRAEAGKRLNRVTGTSIFRGGVGRPGPGGEPHGNWEEASRDFLAWIEKHKKKLRFDENRQVWLTD